MSKKQKIMSMADAIHQFVKDGDVFFLGGFIQHDPYAAVHEIIRQKKRDLTVSKIACLISVDQLIGAGVLKHLITSFTWNPLPATAHCFVRAMTKETPRKIEVEEYSLLALNLAYLAGSMNLPYIATKTLMGSDFDGERSTSGAKNRLKFEKSPFTGERVCLVPPITHDVGIIHVQRADPFGNAQVWGMTGESYHGIQSCEKIIICAEEIVSTDQIMHDPNRTLIPDFRVNAVVEEPWGCHPGPLTGYHDMDWIYYAYYERETRTQEGFENFMKKWVYEVEDRKEYLSLMKQERLDNLRIEDFHSLPVTYGKPGNHFEV